MILVNWLAQRNSASAGGVWAAYYILQHDALHPALPVVFAVLAVSYFAIGGGAGQRFPWHLAWGQVVLMLAGVLLMESPAAALLWGGMPFQGEQALAAFRFWSAVSSAGYLAIWASLLLFAYLMFAGFRAQKAARK
jgi:hypothetical protein